LASSYFEISKICHESKEPVFIVQNGKRDVAIISMELYEEILGKKHLYSLMEEGLNDINNGNVLSEEEMDKSIDLM
jgi:PHD/YefM family antitoxin component YafN of YafNO toxin-antitoxin module